MQSAHDQTQRKFGRYLLATNRSELLREDDLLLQATVWSQALIFVFTSLYGTDVTVHMYRVSYVMPAKFSSYGIAILTVAFYLIRAFAKLKDSNRLRRWSAFMLAGIVLVNLQSLFVFISPPVNFLGGILGSEETKFFSAGFVMMIGWALLLFANHLGEIRYRD